jgi:hypothetical protein
MFKIMIDLIVILLFFTFFGVVMQMIIMDKRGHACIGIESS